MLRTSSPDCQGTPPNKNGFIDSRMITPGILGVEEKTEDSHGKSIDGPAIVAFLSSCQKMPGGIARATEGGQKARAGRREVALNCPVCFVVGYRRLIFQSQLNAPPGIRDISGSSQCWPLPGPDQKRRTVLSNIHEVVAENVISGSYFGSVARRGEITGRK